MMIKKYYNENNRAENNTIKDKFTTVSVFKTLIGLYFSFLFSFGYFFNMYLLALVGAFFVVGLIIFRDGSLNIKFNKKHSPLFIWIFIWLISCAYSLKFDYALKYVIYLVIITLSFVALDEETLKKVPNWLMFFCGIHIAFILIQAFNNSFVVLLTQKLLKPAQFAVAQEIYIYAGALTGITGQSGAAALYCVTFISTIIPKAVKNRWWYLLIVPAFIALMLTQKRSFLFLSFVLVVIAEFFFIKSKSLKKKISFVLICIVAVTIAYYLIGEYFDVTRMIGKINRGSDSNRSILRSEMITLFFDHPLLGCGLYSTDALFGMTGHNIYLQLLCENGAVAAIFYIYCFIGLINLIFKIKSNNETILFSRITLLFTLLYGLVGNPIYEYVQVVIIIYSYVCLTNFKKETIWNE